MQTHFKCLSLLLLALFWFGTGTLQAQLLEQLHENHWEFAQHSPRSFANHTDYIGNHPCLELQQPLELEKLGKIAKERSGTLFIVAKLKAQISDATLLKIGGLRITTNSIFCGGLPIGEQQLTEAPFLLKVKYQSGYKRKWDKNEVFASEHLAIAEIIHYKEQLSDEQSRQIESYLALKYSINITANSNPTLRDYEAVNGSQYWTEKSDGLYNEEVLSLGRIDQWNWQQNQTLSADSRSILLSLEDNTSLGAHPNTETADGSVLVVSKRSIDLETEDCKTSQYILPWKFNFYNWKSDAETLFLSWETSEVVPQTPFFSNGNIRIPLEYSLKDGKIALNIPLEKVQTLVQETWFLQWSGSPISCQPLGSLQMTHCNPKEDQVNELRIEIDDAQLPVQYLLKDTKSGALVKGIITTPVSVLQHIPGSQYQFSVSNRERSLFEEVLYFPTCGSQNETGLEAVLLHILPNSAETDNKNLVGHFANDAIALFRNPIKGTNRYITATFGADYQGIELEVEILDQTGKVLSTEQFTPEFGHHYQTKQFVNSGTYFIQFKSPTHLVVKQVVVL